MANSNRAVDVFEGLRVLPRDEEELRHHLGNINALLQSRYCVPTELAEFALQPERSGEFYQFYQAEAERLVGRLNKTTRSAIELRADPRTCPAGMTIIHGSSNGEPTRDRVDLTTVAVSNKENELTNGANNGTDSGHIPQAPRYMTALELLTSALGQSTPAGQTLTHHIQHGQQMSTATPMNDLTSTITVDSSTRPKTESCLFSTPPEFKGFNVPMATPSSSDGCSPFP